jgi:hypothetical protein
VPVSSAVRERVRAFLPPDDEIRYVFPVTDPTSAPDCFIVVVTKAAITVLSTGFLGRSTPKAIWARYPRNTRMGPVDLSVIPTFQLGSTSYEIDDEYVPVVNAADAEILSPDCMPPDPLPDL